MMLQKRLQRVQYAAASFVTGQYVKSIKDILKLGWLLIEQRRDLSLLEQIFKALNSDTWPDNLQLNVRRNKRELRSNSAISLEIPRDSGTFQDSATRLFNSLPDVIIVRAVRSKKCVDCANRDESVKLGTEAHYRLYVRNLRGDTLRKSLDC